MTHIPVHFSLQPDTVAHEPHVTAPNSCVYLSCVSQLVLLAKQKARKRLLSLHLPTPLTYTHVLPLCPWITSQRELCNATKPSSVSELLLREHPLPHDSRLLSDWLSRSCLWSESWLYRQEFEEQMFHPWTSPLILLSTVSNHSWSRPFNSVASRTTSKVGQEWWGPFWTFSF